VAFADTLFKADFKFNDQEDGVIWTQKVEDPSSFGVIKLDSEGYIIDMVEKPATFVSDLAIVGIYYFKEGEKLRDALRHIITNNIREKNEYQLTTALAHLKNQGARFRTGQIEEWLDCGTKENILHSNARMLEIHQEQRLIAATALVENSVIIPPCFIGENAVIRNSVIGPHVSVGHHSKVESTIISNSIVQNQAHLKNAVLESSLIGNASRYEGSRYALDLGDFSNFSKR
jgi:glucose-1-phosphate thymidylyltransferase